MVFTRTDAEKLGEVKASSSGITLDDFFKPGTKIVTHGIYTVMGDNFIYLFRHGR